MPLVSQEHAQHMGVRMVHHVFPMSGEVHQLGMFMLMARDTAFNPQPERLQSVSVDDRGSHEVLHEQCRCTTAPCGSA
jgi:hypothetical protein